MCNRPLKSRLCFTGLCPKNAKFVNYHQTNLENRLNGDYNPLHATPEPGKKMGFGGAIIHGLYTWNTAAHAVLKSLGGSNPANIKEFQARFAAPVIPGDKLVVEMWRTNKVDNDGFEEIIFITRVDGGKTVLSNGRALLKVDSGAQSKL
jgi:acyl dehydratase